MSESTILWILGTQSTVLIGMIALVARSIARHTEQCRQWQERFLVEHGEMRAGVESAIRRLDRLEALNIKGE